MPQLDFTVYFLFVMSLGTIFGCFVLWMPFLIRSAAFQSEVYGTNLRQRGEVHETTFSAASQHRVAEALFCVYRLWH